MVEVVPKVRKIIMDFFKKQLGYGYRCSTCDRNARITEASTSEFSVDYVGFRCPGCHNKWGMELKDNPIRKLLA